MLSDVMEDYLKAIYQLERQTGDRVSTSAIADHLDVSAPTVTSMLTNLDDHGLVDYEKYRGVGLTEEGEMVALEVLRHHRLLEAYLAEQLDYDWSEVHDEADALEHHISEEFERRIAKALGDPEVDPHGEPIPSPDLEPIADDETTRLDQHDPGETVIVERVRDREPEELQYLSNAGIKPGTTVTVTDVAPFGMMTVVLSTGGEQSLPAEVAASIRVRAAAGEPGQT